MFVTKRDFRSNPRTSPDYHTVAIPPPISISRIFPGFYTLAGSLRRPTRAHTGFLPRESSGGSHQLHRLRRGIPRNTFRRRRGRRGEAAAGTEAQVSRSPEGGPGFRVHEPRDAIKARRCAVTLASASSMPFPAIPAPAEYALLQVRATPQSAAGAQRIARFHR